MWLQMRLEGQGDRRTPALPSGFPIWPANQGHRQELYALSKLVAFAGNFGSHRAIIDVLQLFNL
jgi:hypothetical protein